MIRPIFTLIFASIPWTAALTPGVGAAAVYYVDASAGSDNAAGNSPDSPWRSLTKAGQTPLQPGDYVLLKRGETWYERLQISSSGAPDTPVTFGAYGAGQRPVLDGSRMTLSASLIAASGVTGIAISGLAVRNATRHGMTFSNSSSLSFRDLEVSGSQQHGIIVFDSERITIEDSEIFGNSLDLSNSYDGIRIDGTARRPLESFIVRNCRIYQNVGGAGWKSGNGIFLGHTGSNTPELRKVHIAANDVDENGNPNQNQAGRGITGTFDGDVRLTGNRIRRNASAGVYLGDLGSKLDISIVNNYFYNNALRQFGGFTETTALGEGNTLVVDDPWITAMGIEIGGGGTWKLTGNVFCYTTNTEDRFRGFVRIFTPEQDSRLVSDRNIFFSEGPRRWFRSDGTFLNFRQWQAAGYDGSSKSLESGLDVLGEGAKQNGKGYGASAAR